MMSEELGREKRVICLEGEEVESGSCIAPPDPVAGASLNPLRIFSSLLLCLFVLLGCLLAAAPAAATLVVFGDGRHVRVASYDVMPGGEDGDGDRVSMKLVGGGSMTVSLDVVDRIVDDEYERPAPAPERDERLAGGDGAPATTVLTLYGDQTKHGSPLNVLRFPRPASIS